MAKGYKKVELEKAEFNPPFVVFVILAVINYKLCKNEKKINPNIIYCNSWLRK